MRIAVCDDNTKELNTLSKLLSSYREKKPVLLTSLIRMALRCWRMCAKAVSTFCFWTS